MSGAQTYPAPARILNTALSQTGRVRAAPHPDIAAADGRTTAELLAFAAEYGTLINFYDLQDQPDGDWSVFFRHDPAVAIALQAGLDPAGIEAEFESALTSLAHMRGRTQRLEAATRILRACLRLIAVLDGTAFTATTFEQDLRATLARPRLDHLAHPLLRLARHLGDETLEAALHRNSNIWFAALCATLTDAVTNLLKLLRERNAAARTELTTALHSGGHAPQASLYNAFAILFAHPQTAMNRFSQRLLTFYDDTVLRQSSLGAVPDQTFITFTTAKDVAEAAVPRGTLFPAGTDAAGMPVNYAAAEALTVRASALAHLRILRLASAALPGTTAPVPAQLLTGEAPVLPQTPVFAQPFPLFGAAQSGASGGVMMQPAHLGFGFSGDIFALAGGTRILTLTLTPTAASAQALATLLQPLVSQTGQSATTLLAQTIQLACTLSFTTAAGWAAAPGFTASATRGGAILVTATLGPEQAPLAAPPDAAPPGIMFALNQAPVAIGLAGAPASVNPYSLLSLVILASATITVTVAGLAPAGLASSTGPLDPAQNFLPFGLPPAQGSMLTITAPELFTKPLSALSLTIGWAGLPVTSGGFAGYYKAYTINENGQTATEPLFTNASFQVALGVQNPGLWTLTTAQLTLFGTATGTVPVPPFSILTAPAPTPAIPPPAYQSVASALTLTLTAPSYAFGNILYSANMMAASLAQSTAAGACAQLCAQRFGGGTGAAATFSKLAALNATTPDAAYSARLRASVAQGLGTLTGDALAAVQDAIAHSGASAELQAAWAAQLDAALTKSTTCPLAALWYRLTHGLAKPPEAANVMARLSAWLTANAAAIAAAPAAAPHIAHAQAILAQGAALNTAQSTAAAQAPALARPRLGAALAESQASLTATEADRLQDCLSKCLKCAADTPLPNQPWAPMAASLTLGYSATVTLPTASAGSRFTQMLPFGGSASLPWPSSGVPLLFQPGPQGALYLGLSAPVADITLLFITTNAGDRGSAPPVTWDACTAPDAQTGSWLPASLMQDGTAGMQNTGIVNLRFSQPATWLRASVAAGAEVFPGLVGLTANALTAIWSGPGGGAGLGVPLPAGTITAANPAIPTLGTVSQPIQSFGGRPAATGQPFAMWMAERRRHKSLAIQSWDYASLVLADFPSLWQAAVCDATDATGAPAPGHVWLAVIPGPTTPGITDTTIPTADPATLAGIKEMLSTRVSPFLTLSVTNAPFLRLAVTAQLEFSPTDTPDAWSAKLNSELIAWLSPWPDASLPPRPEDYYAPHAVAGFIRARPYVTAILSFAMHPQTLPPPIAYLTSSLAHSISGITAAAPVSAGTLP